MTSQDIESPELSPEYPLKQRSPKLVSRFGPSSKSTSSAYSSHSIQRSPNVSTFKPIPTLSLITPRKRKVEGVEEDKDDNDVEDDVDEYDEDDFRTPVKNRVEPKSKQAKSHDTITIVSDDDNDDNIHQHHPIPSCSQLYVTETPLPDLSESKLEGKTYPKDSEIEDAKMLVLKSFNKLQEAFWKLFLSANTREKLKNINYCLECAQVSLDNLPLK
jgi:hypothetical protein